MTRITDFITRWKASGGSEQANSQLFLAQLCDVLGLVQPDPARPINEENTYSFERKVFVPRGDGSNELKRLDLYRKGCFVLEAKQAYPAPAWIPAQNNPCDKNQAVLVRSHLQCVAQKPCAQRNKCFLH